MPITIEQLRRMLDIQQQRWEQNKITVTILPKQSVTKSATKKNGDTYIVMTTTKQDLLKVFLWRLISIPISVLTTYLFTGRADLSLSLTILLTIILTTGQFFYEKLWRYINK